MSQQMVGKRLLVGLFRFAGHGVLWRGYLLCNITPEIRYYIPDLIAVNHIIFNIEF